MNKDRETGYYWIKIIGDDSWIIALHEESFGIKGWWYCGEEHAIYDDDIAEFGERIAQKQ